MAEIVPPPIPPPIPPPVPPATPRVVPPPLPPLELRLDREHPWPGLISFAEADHAFFFGREREVAELARVIRQKTVTVFFGKSGLGKSSILRAGVSPLLRQSELVPVYIRLNHDEAAPPLEDQVEIAIEDVLAKEKIDAAKPVRSETLWEYFHKKTNNWWDPENRLVKPILIFDQFEELLTLGQSTPKRAARSAAFLTELEDLVENRPPTALLQRFEAERGLARNYDLEGTDYRVVLTLREDFLPDLEGLRERLRAIMFNRVRLLPMSGEQAMDVVLKPGSHLVDEDVAVRIVDFVSSSERSRLQTGVTRAQLAKRSVEPALLSVVLQELNNRRIRLGQEKITAELVGQTNPTEIFHDFYLRGLQGMDGEVRDFIEDCLLTSSGARNRIAEEDALTRQGMSAEVVSKLIDRRIIQRETTGNTKWLELTHDTLADVVRTDRAKHQQQRQLQLAAEREASARSKLRRVRKLATAFAGLLILALLALSWAVIENRKARRARDFTNRTTDSLANGILRDLEQNPRIRINEKLILAQRLREIVQNLQGQSTESSNELCFRLADLLASASLMLFDAGRIDEGIELTAQANSFLERSAPNEQSNSLVPVRVKLVRAIAEHFNYRNDRALALLDEAEKKLRTISTRNAKQSDTLLLASKLALNRSGIVYQQSNYQAADDEAKSAISNIERVLSQGNSLVQDERTRRGLIRNLLELLLVRFHVAQSTSQITPMKAICAEFDRWLRDGKSLGVASRTGSGSASEPGLTQLTDDQLWSFYGARQLQIAADILRRSGDPAQALEPIGSAIAKFHDLVADDSDNMLWRYSLGEALCGRADIALSAGAMQGYRGIDPGTARTLAKTDCSAASKLATTLRRDQRNTYLAYHLARLVDYTDGSAAAAASLLARIKLESKRAQSNDDFQEDKVFAHIAFINAVSAKEPYEPAVKHAEEALAELNTLKSPDKAALRRTNELRLSVLNAVLGIEPDKLGQERWLHYHDAARSVLKDLMTAGATANDFDSLCIIASKRADELFRKEDYSAALPAYQEAAQAAFSAVRKGEDQRSELQNYLYIQRRVVDCSSALRKWDVIVRVCRETHKTLSDLVKANPKLVIVFPFVEMIATTVDQARKSFDNGNQSEQHHEIASNLAAESQSFWQDAEEYKHRRAKENVASAYALATHVRIDVQNFSITDFTMAKSGNHYLVKQRIGWSEGPIFPAAWRTVFGSEFDEISSSISQVAGISADQIQRIRVCPLSFYDRGQLIEAEYSGENGDLYTMPIIAAAGKFYRLNGTSPPIHQANAEAPLRLAGAADAAAYLRLFCSYVRGGEDQGQPFQIVESVMDLPWSNTAPAGLKRDIGRLLLPLVVWPDPDVPGHWRARATVQFSDNIFHAKFKIQKTGMIEMEDDVPVASDVPLALGVYRGGDRADGRLETLDLGMIHPPEGDNAVDMLLSAAESLRIEPARAADLTDEAVQLQSEITSSFGNDQQSQKKLEGMLAKLSWYRLLTKNFRQALEATEAALKIDSWDLIAETNRAHALLFLGRTAEAEEIYRKYIGQKIQADSQKTWEQTILEDFDQLEKDGLSHPEFNRIREFLKAGATASQASTGLTTRLPKNLFTSMDFLLGKENDGVIIVVPAKLPETNLIVYVAERHLTFANGDQLLADVTYQGGDIRRRLLKLTAPNENVGIVENVPGEKLPNHITNVASVREGNPPGLHE